MQPNQNPNVQPNPAIPQPVEGQPKVEAPQASVAPEAAPQPVVPAPAATVVPASVTSPPVPQAPATNPGQQLPVQNIVPAVGANPAVAEDVDVIEKEWVDQADKVIDKTKDDPYQEEESVEALQVDYLKKRYGHDVKKPDQGA
jgi:hypothetical protein